MNPSVECRGDECASPSPTIDPYSVLPNPDDWPEPPEWMFTALYIVIGIILVVVLVVIVVAVASWRRKAIEARTRQPTEWVNLDDLPPVTRGGVRGAREASVQHGDDAVPEDDTDE